MPRRFRLLFAGVLCLAWPGMQACAAPVQSSFHLHVPVAPTPVTVAGRPLLSYELWLSNVREDTLSVQRVEVVDEQGRTLADWQGEALEARLGGPGARQYREAPRALVPGRWAVLYVELSPDPARVPGSVRHRIHFRADTDDAAVVHLLESARIAVRRTPPVMLGAPLSGGPWVAIHHPDWARGHRRMHYAVNGRARIPGRYAIDWIRLDAQGRQSRGDDDRVADWHGHGAEVLAVADATVAAVRDDMAEKTSVAANRKNALGDATGNYIALDLGEGRYAFYEHLRPGSVRVQVGQRVRRGEAIGALGFTGDSTGPHLHFHVADANSPLDAEGVPYVFDRFEWIGRYDSLDGFGKAPWSPLAEGDAAERRDERPAPNSVVRFPP
ncbi:M23 family metallopeptidase [Pseudoxanthomonas putridarboris]|uniref:M23 family metallopeptidase n=1 Tax=Pseudoxanthomonas putridarboris TaxID=752605 RepID=A0ABU9J4E6_9GAMM